MFGQTSAPESCVDILKLLTPDRPNTCHGAR